MAQAVRTDTRSALIAQLLAPIAAPGDAPAAKRFLREVRDEAEKAWCLAQLRYYAADAYRTYCAHSRRIAEIERRTHDVPEAAAEAQAHLHMIAVVDRMMHVPAPTIGALRQKQKLRGFDKGRDRWEAAIAADQARLENPHAER